MSTLHLLNGVAAGLHQNMYSCGTHVMWRSEAEHLLLDEGGLSVNDCVTQPMDCLLHLDICLVATVSSWPVPNAFIHLVLVVSSSAWFHYLVLLCFSPYSSTTGLLVATIAVLIPLSMHVCCAWPPERQHLPSFAQKLPSIPTSCLQAVFVQALHFWGLGIRHQVPGCFWVHRLRLCSLAA